MTDHTDRSNNPFAGEKKPSMLRRCSGNDYRSRRMYMITMTTTNRTPWFGQIVGSTNAPWGSEDFPHIALSPLGWAVGHCWFDIHTHHPEIEVVMLQMMPAHLHGILFVKEELTRPLGKVINGFKVGCNKAFRKLFKIDFRICRRIVVGECLPGKPVVLFVRRHFVPLAGGRRIPQERTLYVERLRFLAVA